MCDYSKRIDYKERRWYWLFRLVSLRGKLSEWRTINRYYGGRDTDRNAASLNSSLSHPDSTFYFPNSQFSLTSRYSTLLIPEVMVLTERERDIGKESKEERVSKKLR